METQPNITELLNQYKCCVIITTHNNGKTLTHFINWVLAYTKNIIIVNNYNTSKTLQDFSQLEIINLSKNIGNTLHYAIKKAEELNFEYAITIDNDRQHFLYYIPLFINELDKSKNKDILLIGGQNLNPSRIAKHNTFYNFWYQVNIDKNLSKTHPDFVLFPVKKVSALKLFETKYDFKINTLGEVFWADIEVRYIDNNKQISSFLSFKNLFSKNLQYIYLAFIYLSRSKPRDFLRKIRKKGIKIFFLDDFLSSKDSNLKKSLSVSLGVFIGMSPFWGLQTILTLFLAQILKLNKTISFLFSNISIPPFLPFIIYGNFKVGAFLLNKKFSLNLNEITKNFDPTEHLSQYLIGSITLSTIFAVLFGAISYGVLVILKKKK